MNEQRTSGIATVMFTDVEASTDITTRLGDDAAAPLFAAHDALVREQLAAFGGRDVRSTGDGFLVVFDSARGRGVMRLGDPARAGGARGADPRADRPQCRRDAGGRRRALR